MANVALSSVTDPNLPEPKNISTALQGQVYVADGAGSGVWADSSISTYGAMTITNNATATVVPAAVDGTLATNTDYVAVSNWATGIVSNVSYASDMLTVLKTGNYKISFWGTLKVPKNNNFIAIKYRVNSTTFSTQRLETQSTTANDFKTLTADAIIALSANDTLEIMLACTLGDSIIVQDAGLIVSLL